MTLSLQFNSLQLVSDSNSNISCLPCGVGGGVEQGVGVVEVDQADFGSSRFVRWGKASDRLDDKRMWDLSHITAGEFIGSEKRGVETFRVQHVI